MEAKSRPVRVVVDSAADIPQEIAEELGIAVVPLRLHVGGKTYLDGVEISGEQFYRELEASRSVTTTSLPTLEALSDTYRSLTSQGYDVVAIHMSSKLSGTFNAALMASTADGVPPEAVSVVDSRTFSMAQGWIAIRAAQAAQEGRSREEVEELAQKLLPRARLYGVLDTIEYVIRSGRLGRLPGTIGTLLQIKPIMSILPSGEAVLVERMRTRRKALERVVDLLGEAGQLDALAIMHGADPEGAQLLLEMVAPLKPPEPIIVGHIGAVLGTHLGPGAVGVCFLTREA